MNNDRQQPSMLHARMCVLYVWLCFFLTCFFCLCRVLCSGVVRYDARDVNNLTLSRVAQHTRHSNKISTTPHGKWRVFSISHTLVVCAPVVRVVLLSSSLWLSGHNGTRSNPHHTANRSESHRITPSHTYTRPHSRAMSDAPIAEDEQPVADAANDNHNTNDTPDATPDDGSTTQADAGQKTQTDKRDKSRRTTKLTIVSPLGICAFLSLSPSSFSSILVVSRFLPSSCCCLLGDWQWCGGGSDEASDSDGCDSIPYNQFLTLP